MIDPIPADDWDAETPHNDDMIRSGPNPKICPNAWAWVVGAPDEPSGDDDAVEWAVGVGREASCVASDMVSVTTITMTAMDNTSATTLTVRAMAIIFWPIVSFGWWLPWDNPDVDPSGSSSVSPIELLFLFRLMLFLMTMVLMFYMMMRILYEERWCWNSRHRGWCGGWWRGFLYLYGWQNFYDFLTFYESTCSQ